MTDLEDDWVAQEPTPGFSERVVAAAMREGNAASPSPPARPRLGRVGLGLAAAAVAAAAIALVVVTRDERVVTAGDVTANERIEVAIGGRAVAVLEAGARVSWTGTRVEQHRGDVFYRVEPGSTFTVHTPTADAAVLGTCFRIRIDDQETVMNRRDLGASAVGAVAATLVVIGVYEGRVQVTGADRPVMVRAGQSAVATREAVRVDDGTGTTTVRTSMDDVARLKRSAKELEQRLQDLEAEKAALELELSATGTSAPAKHPFDLSKEDWAKLAEQGAFKYRLPCYRTTGNRPTEAQLDKLGLDAKAGDDIAAAYERVNARVGTKLLSVCARAGFPADPRDGKSIGTCIGKMFASLYTNGAGNARDVFRQVGEIRAGKRVEPVGDQIDPALDMLLFFTTVSGLLEQDLATTFGPDEAHRLIYSDELCFLAQQL